MCVKPKNSMNVTIKVSECVVLIGIKLSHILVNNATDRLLQIIRTINFARRSRHENHERLLTGENEQ